jgi:hypothetical protein
MMTTASRHGSYRTGAGAVRCGCASSPPRAAAAADRACRPILLLLSHCAVAGLSSSVFSMMVGSGRWRRAVGAGWSQFGLRIFQSAAAPFPFVLFFLCGKGLK